MDEPTQQDRQKQADVFVRSMFKKPQAEDYLKRVIDAPPGAGRYRRLLI